MLGKRIWALGIVACVSVLLLSGCGSSSSTQNPADEIAQQGLFYGFWAGNVEVVPSQPSELPALFYEKAPATAAVPLDSQGRPVRMDPRKISKPLWVFADHVSLQDVADKVHAAEAAERPIVIIGAEQSAIEEVFGQTVDSRMSGDMPVTQIAWSWLPWMSPHLTEGQLVTATDGKPSTEEMRAKYFEFMVDSTMRLAPPETRAN